MDKVIKSFRNKKGYKIKTKLVHSDTHNIDYMMIQVFYRSGTKSSISEYVTSSWGDEDEVGYGYYLRTIEYIARKIRNKTARRYFFKEVRNLKIGNATFSEFIKSNGTVDWNKLVAIDKLIFERKKEKYEKEHGPGSWPENVKTMADLWQ